MTQEPEETWLNETQMDKVLYPMDFCNASLPDFSGNASNESMGMDSTYVHCMENPEEMLRPWVIHPSFMSMSITHAITFLIGVVGNVTVMVGMIGDRKSRNATNMFLVSLAMADLLLLLVCAPLETMQYFVIGFDEEGTVCKMAKFTELLSAVASVLNLTAVSLERFIVIVFPMRSRSLCTMSNCRKAVIGVWLISLLLTSPVIVTKGISSITFVNQQTSVSVTIHYCLDRADALAFSVYQFLILFALPGLLMTVCYAAVIRELWISTRNMTLLTNSSHRPTPMSSRTSLQPSLRYAYHASFRSHAPCHTPCHGPCRGSASELCHTATSSGSAHSTPSPATKHNHIELRRLQSQNSSQHSTSHEESLSQSVRGRSVIRRRPFRTDDARQARKQVIKMLILVVLLYLICWGPRLIMDILMKKQIIDYTPTVYSLRVACFLLPYVHSCINPIIYSLMSRNFRRSMARKCCWGMCARESPTKTKSCCYCACCPTEPKVLTRRWTTRGQERQPQRRFQSSLYSDAPHSQTEVESCITVM